MDVDSYLAALRLATLGVETSVGVFTKSMASTGTKHIATIDGVFVFGGESMTFVPEREIVMIQVVPRDRECELMETARKILADGTR
jgi:hypothetical protein